MRLLNQKRVILVSVPKAGTYLMFEVLRRIGLRESFLHIQHDHRAIGAYNLQNAPKKLLRGDKVKYFQPMPFSEALALVKPGEFAVGHIPPIPEVKQFLRIDFKIVFLVRDLRDCLISHMRYMISTGEIVEQDHPWCTIADDKERFKQYLLNYADEVGPLEHMKLIACWEYDILNPYPGMDLFKLRFEDMTSSDRAVTGLVIKSLANFLDIDSPQDIDALLNQVLAAETLTKSSGPTKRETYWSPFAEQWFNERVCDLQGNNVNKLMGYV